MEPPYRPAVVWRHSRTLAQPSDDAAMSQRCEACGATLDTGRDRRYCSGRCRQRGYRMRVAARHAEPWQAAAQRLVRDAPERWAAAPARIVCRDVDDELLSY